MHVLVQTSRSFLNNEINFLVLQLLFLNKKIILIFGLLHKLGSTLNCFTCISVYNDPSLQKSNFKLNCLQMQKHKH